MAYKNGIRKLVKEWNQLPPSIEEHLDVSHREILHYYLNVFNIGPSFFLVFNTKTNLMEHVSPEITSILGYKPEEFTVNLLLEIVHPDDSEFYEKAHAKAVEFYSTLPPELFLEYKYTATFRYRDPHGQYSQLHQTIIPIHALPTGGTRTLAIYTDVSHLQIQGPPRLSLISMNGIAPCYYNLNLGDGFQVVEKIFTKREFEILKEIVANKNSKQIADELCISLYTVQTHRKNIIRKSGCDSMQDLIVKAVRDGWV